MRIDPTQIPTKDLHQYLLGAVAPRPIAFASTLSKEGVPNLAPYSFFNAFSSNPPILVFSSNRRVADNTTKDTLKNIEDTGEVVINAVSHSIVRQMAVCSIEYPAGVNEFEKAGLTPLPSERVKPFRVAESPAQMECIVERILPLGDGGGAGHLIVCKIVMMHLDDRVLDEQKRIDPHKIDLMARMGRAYYVRASGAAVMEIVQEVGKMGIGFDGLPMALRNSPVLTGNNLGQLAGLTSLPTHETALAWAAERPKVQIFLSSKEGRLMLHHLAKKALDGNDLSAGAHLAVLGA
jgi:flavin reductase (DIM6/NTAB) family NADH-FMN oxidoreductase RutF